MTTEVNLLPIEKKPKTHILKLSRGLKKFLTILIFIFLITTCGFVAAYFIFSNQLKDLKDKQTKIKQQISALEQTEQRLFLLKDRLAKIQQIKGKESAAEEIEVLEFVNGILDEKTQFSEASLETKRVVLVLETTNSLELAKFINNLIEKGNFKEITLSSLNLSTEGNYSLEFILTR